MGRNLSVLTWGCLFGGRAIVLAAVASSMALADDPVVTSPAAQEQAKKLDDMPPIKRHGNEIVIDHSGRKEAGKASVYSRSFEGKPMANGGRYSAARDSAASKTLPLGTIAKVTNLESGKSVEVKVEDRGPFVSGRVIDLTPRTAGKLGVTTKEGIAPVVIAPVTVPQVDGSVKVGAGAAGAPGSIPAR